MLMWREEGFAAEKHHACTSIAIASIFQLCSGLGRERPRRRKPRENWELPLESLASSAVVLTLVWNTALLYVHENTVHDGDRRVCLRTARRRRACHT